MQISEDPTRHQMTNWSGGRTDFPARRSQWCLKLNPKSKFLFDKPRVSMWVIVNKPGRACNLNQGCKKMVGLLTKHRSI